MLSIGFSVADRLSPERRSALMSKISSKDTAPELLVRSIAHRLGYRFRLHRHDLPGTPDLVFPRLGKIIFVHGCFWHGHYCKREKMPKSRVAFWSEKILSNKARDRRNHLRLVELGWQCKAIWECEIKHPAKVTAKIAAFLNRRSGDIVSSRPGKSPKPQ